MNKNIQNVYRFVLHHVYVDDLHINLKWKQASAKLEFNID